MPWIKDTNSLSYAIYTIYMDTIKIFLQPQISDLFDDGRKKSRLELLKRLHDQLKKVYELEMRKREDEPFDY